MARGRPSYGFLLIDLPSDHEVESNIIRECQMIEAILHNRELGSRVKSLRATTAEGFLKAGWAQYKRIGFVHLSTHGGRKGINLIGGTVGWPDVAKRLARIAPALKKNQTRVLCLSCCHSETGLELMKPVLKTHFTHAYHFAINRITFATAMTIWSMFYRKKTLQRPLRAIGRPINDFFEADRIAFQSI